MAKRNAPDTARKIAADRQEEKEQAMLKAYIHAGGSSLTPEVFTKIMILNLEALGFVLMRKPKGVKRN